MDERRPADAMTWRTLAIVLCAMAALVAFVDYVTTFRPESRPQLTCMNNISQLGQMFVMARQEKRFDPTLHGSAQILSWLGANGLKDGEERVLVCPGDSCAMIPETPDECRPFHPADAAALRRAVGLGSYAVRDFERFPLDDDATEKQMILCDRQGNNGRTMHHKNAIVVVYAYGDAQKLSREELGFGPDEPIVVGPDSPNAELRKMERP